MLTMYFSFWQVADRRIPALKIKVIMFIKYEKKRREIQGHLLGNSLDQLWRAAHMWVSALHSFLLYSKRVLSWQRSGHAHLLQKLPQDGHSIFATFLLHNMPQVLNWDPLPATPHPGRVHSAVLGQSSQENCRVPIYNFYYGVGADSLILADLLVQL